MVPANKIELTEYQENYLREHYLTKTIRELSQHLGLKPTLMRTKAYEMGLKKFEMVYWTDEQVEFVEFVYKYIGDTEIADYMNLYLPRGKRKWNKKAIEKKRSKIGLKRSAADKRAIKHRNILLGCFKDCSKKAWDVRGVSPIGTISITTTAKGKKVVTVKTESGYVLYAPVLWEQHNGPVPDGMVVHVLPDSPEIPKIEHLVLKTRAEMMDIIRYCDATIAKRFLGAEDDTEVEYLAENHPELIDLKRNELKVNGKLRELHKKGAGAKR